MNLELTPQEIDVIQKAIVAYEYIVENIINGDTILDEVTLKDAIDRLLIMKAINLKLNN